MAESATHAVRRTVEYEAAQSAQRKLTEERRTAQIPDLLWLLEHPPTITWGSSGGRQHILLAEDVLRARGIALSRSERGGDVTFHEPGQLVGYLIVDLRGAFARDVHAYLRGVEEGILSCLAGFGIAGCRIARRTGVWIDGERPRKIAAMGVRAKGWIASHGFALNVENRLDGFELIVPCGLSGTGVTSLEREIQGRPLPPWRDIELEIHGALEAALQLPLRLLRAEEGLHLAGLL
ncbi:MAG TPA: lipoyl(octanoyl) transferase LipB [Planctomycetota bacterium]|nr:lipoyl(octanoyl) transferase LipB [Planctomycetota bacterium]